MTVSIISGCPGSGKTTLAHALASSHQNGIHIITDVFYDFIPNRLDPSTPASKAQNEAVVRAFSHAGASFDIDQYQVYLDGVIGPWMIPVLSPILGQFNYVLLSVDLESATQRVASRESPASARLNIVARMHPQFEALEKDYKKHTIFVAEKSPDQIVEEYQVREATGQFLYDDT